MAHIILSLTMEKAMPNLPGRKLQSYRVWDVPTRLFHWINFACLVALAGLGLAIFYGKELGESDAGKLLLKTTHVWVGYVFAINLIWRAVWLFLGNRHARWSAIDPFQSGYLDKAKSYLASLARGDARPYLGHNPIARATIFVLALLLVTQAVTGLVLAGTDIYYPPFGRWISAWIAAPGVDPGSIAPYDKTGIDPAAWDAMRAFRLPFVTVHQWAFYAILVAAVFHIGGVIVTELREGGDIISAMFTGRKVFDRPPVDDTGDDA